MSAAAKPRSQTAPHPPQGRASRRGMYARHDAIAAKREASQDGRLQRLTGPNSPIPRALLDEIKSDENMQGHPYLRRDLEGLRDVMKALRADPSHPGAQEVMDALSNPNGAEGCASPLCPVRRFQEVLDIAYGADRYFFDECRNECLFVTVIFSFASSLEELKGRVGEAQDEIKQLVDRMDGRRQGIVMFGSLEHDLRPAEYFETNPDLKRAMRQCHWDVPDHGGWVLSGHFVVRVASEHSFRENVEKIWWSYGWKRVRIERLSHEPSLIENVIESFGYSIKSTDALNRFSDIFKAKAKPDHDPRDPSEMITAFMGAGFTLEHAAGNFNRNCAIRQMAIFIHQMGDGMRVNIESRYAQRWYTREEVGFLIDANQFDNLHGYLSSETHRDRPWNPAEAPPPIYPSGHGYRRRKLSAASAEYPVLRYELDGSPWSNCTGAWVEDPTGEAYGVMALSSADPALAADEAGACSEPVASTCPDTLRGGNLSDADEAGSDAGTGQVAVVQRQIAGLLESLAADDDETFFDRAMELASARGYAPHLQLAGQLRRWAGVGHPAGRWSGLSIPLERIGPLAREKTSRGEPLSNLVLEPGLIGELEILAGEHRRRPELETAGIPPRSRLLLSGPCGDGKGSAAASLAGELGLPLITLDATALIAGPTAWAVEILGSVFGELRATPAVCLVDGFDRLIEPDHPKAPATTGALFLGLLGEGVGSSLVVAMMEQPLPKGSSLADPFDLVWTAAPPDGRAITEVFLRRFRELECEAVDWNLVGDLTRGMTAAYIELIAIDVRRRAIVRGAPTVTTDDLVRAVARQERSGHGLSGRRARDGPQ